MSFFLLKALMNTVNVSFKALEVSFDFKAYCHLVTYVQFDWPENLPINMQYQPL